MRPSGRNPESTQGYKILPVVITKHAERFCAGLSLAIPEYSCTASVDKSVPAFSKARVRLVTAEYGMLPPQRYR